MYKNELESLIQSGHNFNSILLYGQSNFYIDYFSKYLASKFVEPSVLKVYYDEFDFEKSKNHLSQASLFGDLNLLIIKSDKQISTTQLSEIIQITKEHENSYFIYEFYSDSGSKLQNLFKSRDKKVDFVRLFHPNFGEAISLLELKSKRLKIQIDRHTLEYLYNQYDQDIALSAKELEKLAVLEEEISPKVIDHVTYNLSMANMDKIFIDLLHKKDVSKEILRLLQEGENEIKIITSLTSFIKELFMFYAFITLKGYNSSKEILGYALPKQIEQLRGDLSIKKIKKDAYAKILKQLQADELYLKSHSKIEKESFLISSIIKIQNLL